MSEAPAKPQRDWVWRAWPWFAWLLPAFYCLVFPEGYGKLVVYLLSPVIIAGGGLLGLLPRFILRKRGFQGTPRSIQPLLIAQWVTMFVAALVPQSNGGINTPSILNTLCGGVFAPLTIEIMTGVSLLLTALLGISIFVLSITVKIKDRPGPKRVWVGNLIAALTIPALVAVTAIGVPLVSALFVDSAGDRYGEIRQRTSDEQAERFRTNYEATQQSISEIRTLINPGTVWYPNYGPPLPLDGEDCNWEGLECYQFEFFYTAEVPIEDEQRRRVEQELQGQGLETSVFDNAETTRWSLRAEGPGGTEIRIVQEFTEDDLTAAEQPQTNIEWRSPTWWGTGKALESATWNGQLHWKDENSTPISADEWPALG